MILKIVLGAAALFFVGALYSCLIVASDADDAMERELKERDDLEEYEGDLLIKTAAHTGRIKVDKNIKIIEGNSKHG